jgi:hypothetical protein
MILSFLFDCRTIGMNPPLAPSSRPVARSSQIIGQDVADSTQQDMARMLDRFELPAPVEEDWGGE